MTDEQKAKIVYDLFIFLTEKNLRPTKISPSVDDSIVMSFLNNGRYAVIECYNTGEIVFGIMSEQNIPVVWEAAFKSEIEESINRIKHYLNKENQT